MARTTSITCTIGAKVNQGNYESTEMSWSETVELAPGDNPAEVRTELHRRVHATVESQVVAFRETSTDERARTTPRRRAVPVIETDDSPRRQREIWRDKTRGEPSPPRRRMRPGDLR